MTSSPLSLALLPHSPFSLQHQTPKNNITQPTELNHNALHPPQQPAETVRLAASWSRPLFLAEQEWKDQNGIRNLSGLVNVEKNGPGTGLQLLQSYNEDNTLPIRCTAMRETSCDVVATEFVPLLLTSSDVYPD